MKRKIFSFLIIFFCLSVSYGQEAEKKEKTEDKPVRYVWNSGTLIDQQTSYIPSVNTFESVIQHRFGSMHSNMSDLFGIYSPGANLRMGFNFVIHKNIQIGYGLTKENMYNDFNVKWGIFKQTRKNKIPISVTFFGNMAISGNPDKVYGLDYAFGNRFSYFSQIILGRKISDAISIQTAFSFTHFNSVGSLMDHDKVAWHLGGRYNFSPQSSFVFNYDLPLKITSISEQREFMDHPKANLSIGYEVSTSTHAFQIFIATSTGIVPQDIVMYNQNDLQNRDFSIGFVITRLWNF